MTLFLVSLILLAAGSVLLWIFAGFRKIGGYVFLWLLVSASGLGLICAIKTLFLGQNIAFKAPWHVPLGEFYIGLDPLSSFFLIPFFILSALAGVYGYAYLQEDREKNICLHLGLYCLLILSIALVMTAKNAVLFLAAWEMMTISSYFLITFYDEKESVRSAGYIYLIATHTGAFCLFAMFLLMGNHAGSLNFDQMSAVSFPSILAGIIFVLAVVGFGVKAGFIPFHIWLPHAHPVAPTHVSALLSGVVIKVGIYGLMRVIAIVHDFPSWCGLLLLMIGVISGVGGVLYALGQHEIKKLLAYHSIENIGIITLGLAMGLMAQGYHQDAVAFIGYAAALLHVFNHAVFKGLLFLGAGSVIRKTHTGEIDQLGGLIKHLPWTGNLFLIGSLSICGLPVFNGFISEWLVYQSLLGGVFHLNIYGIIFSCIAIVGLALIGGLAALCFAKAFGAIFLGEPRSPIERVQEPGWMWRMPMMCLAMICVWVGLFPSMMVTLALKGAQTSLGIVLLPETARMIIQPLMIVSGILMVGVVVFLGLYGLRRALLSRYPSRETETWTCGYSSVSPRMQYTASSFAKPILLIFRSVLMYRVDMNYLKKYFPATQTLHSLVEDASESRLFGPLFRWIKKASKELKWIQSGQTQKYLLYIFFFLIFLLIWKL